MIYNKSFEGCLLKFYMNISVVCIDSTANKLNRKNSTNLSTLEIKNNLN